MADAKTEYRPSLWKRLVGLMFANRAGTWLILNVTTRIDPPLLRWTKGRFSVASLFGMQALLLITTGAKSGLPRSVALLSLPDGENIGLIASRGGHAHHPGWYHNLRANPEAKVLCGKLSGAYIAHEVEGEERERLWQLARETYIGFDAYEQRAGERRIPVMMLTPKREA